MSLFIDYDIASVYPSVVVSVGWTFTVSRSVGGECWDTIFRNRHEVGTQERPR